MKAMKPGPDGRGVINDDTATVYIEGETNICTIIHRNGRSTWGGQTVREIRAEHPGKRVLVLPWREAVDRVRAAGIEKYTTPVVEVSEEDHDEMLNVLPPENWVRREGWSAFRMSEYYTGRITSHYVTMGGRFYHTRREAGTGVYEVIVNEIREGKFTPLEAEGNEAPRHQGIES